MHLKRLGNEILNLDMMGGVTVGSTGDTTGQEIEFKHKYRNTHGEDPPEGYTVITVRIITGGIGASADFVVCHTEADEFLEYLDLNSKAAIR